MLLNTIVNCNRRASVFSESYFLSSKAPFCYNLAMDAAMLSLLDAAMLSLNHKNKRKLLLALFETIERS